MAEKEYIERERLLDFLQNTYDIPLDQWMARNYWSKVVEIKQKFISCIEKIPAADVVEVVHAEWKCDSDDDQYDGEYYCSACNAEQYVPDNAIFPPYCPHCGAKMDGKEAAP